MSSRRIIVLLAGLIAIFVAGMLASAVLNRAEVAPAPAPVVVEAPPEPAQPVVVEPAPAEPVAVEPVPVTP